MRKNLQGRACSMNDRKRNAYKTFRLKSEEAVWKASVYFEGKY
jgi:hypothetical protein